MRKTPTPHISARYVLLAMAVASVLAVAAALLAQYQFDMQPCPWCILQRAIYLLVALLCVVGALLPWHAPRAVLTAGAFVAAGLGAASAAYQNLVAVKQYSCNLTLADKIINALGLESLSPELFQVTAMCADAVVSVLGVPFEYWSLLLFTLLALAALFVLFRRRAA